MTKLERISRDLYKIGRFDAIIALYQIQEEKLAGNTLKSNSVADASDALSNAFIWGETPQGEAFWYTVYEKLSAENGMPF